MTAVKANRNWQPLRKSARRDNQSLAGLETDALSTMNTWAHDIQACRQAQKTNEIKGLRDGQIGKMTELYSRHSTMSSLHSSPNT